MSVLPLTVIGPLKLGVAAVSVPDEINEPENVEVPEDVKGPLKFGVAAVNDVRLPKEINEE
jgi:hypothetical protein